MESNLKVLERYKFIFYHNVHTLNLWHKFNAIFTVIVLIRYNFKIIKRNGTGSCFLLSISLVSIAFTIYQII